MKNRFGNLRSLLFFIVLVSACSEKTIPTVIMTASPQLTTARTKIKHIIIIMQENRSFDHYFGTYPGADGIPMQDGVPTVCANDPVTRQCIKPFHDASDINYGGPHGLTAAITDINGGKMDGFVQAVRHGRRNYCADPNTPGCTSKDQGPDAMGWHDAREIPNYWVYAQNFVLHDRMFEPSASWSLPAHLFLVSGWSAKCSDTDDAMTCSNEINNPPQANPGSTKEDYAWTDLTYLLHKNNITWSYFLTEGIEPDCSNDQMFCDQQPLSKDVPSVMNPLPNFATVHDNSELDHIRLTTEFFTSLKDGTLPAISWIIPENGVSDHPPSSIHAGQA